ncbi:MAG: thermonuclease family protein [Kofleriaceae bacterium]
MSVARLVLFGVAAGAALVASGCGGERCGPSEGVVANVVDGDTIDLASGERIRYLMVDTPETTGGKNDCFGDNAVQFNTDLVLGKEVSLTYDTECTDRFGRLLAYVSVDGQEVNSLLVQRGYACVLHIPPNGDDRVAEFEALEAAARAADRGLWGNCEPEEILCD